MKNYTLILLIGGLFCISQIEAMEKKATLTNLSAKEERELRQAMINYKKNRSREKSAQIITMYSQTYPNDSLVKAKINEKNRFDKGISKAEELQQKMQESQIQEEESCLVCMEDEDLRPIPCKNKHNDLICNGCLAQVKNQTNTCPICRDPLIQ